MESVPRKRCPYCQHLHPEDDFMKVAKGRGGKVIVAQCGPCYRARQNPEAYKGRLDALVAHNKEANKRTFTALAKEKSR